MHPTRKFGEIPLKFNKLIKNSVRKFTRLSSLLSTALLLASAFASSQVYAADIDCTTDLITGTLGTYANSLYGSCIFPSSPVHPGLLELSAQIYAAVQNSVSLAAPLPAHDLGVWSNNYIVNMGTTAPTLADCIAATYTVNSRPAVTNNWYCAKFVGATDTGYMFAKWDGSVLVAPSPPPTAPTAPTGLTATAASPTQINLSWTDASSDETGFKIFRNGTELTPSPKVGAGIATFSDTGLTCNTAYTYTVKATNANGDSSVAATTPTTTTTAACQAVSAPIFSLKDKPAIFSEEVK